MVHIMSLFSYQLLCCIWYHGKLQNPHHFYFQNPPKASLSKPHSQKSHRQTWKPEWLQQGLYILSQAYVRRCLFYLFNLCVNSWFCYWSCFWFGFVLFDWNVQEKLMGGPGQKQRRSFTLGYTPWRNPIRIWFSSMFDPPKEVSTVFNYSPWLISIILMWSNLLGNESQRFGLTIWQRKWLKALLGCLLILRSKR